MNVNGMGAMQQIQTRAMDGSGNGQGKGGSNGLKDVMQNLSSEDRVTLQEQLSTMSTEEKSAIKDDLKAIDSTNMDSSVYLKSLLDVINDSTSTEVTSSENFEPVYA
jgi:hypothetical protein